MLSFLKPGFAQENKQKSVVESTKSAHSMAEAASQVQVDTGGRVLSIKRMKSHTGKMYFRVKVLTNDSTVRMVMVPEAKAATPARTAGTDQD
jgi:uncharacterized membrane protein YkoI